MIENFWSVLTLVPPLLLQGFCFKTNFAVVNPVQYKTFASNCVIEHMIVLWVFYFVFLYLNLRKKWLLNNNFNILSFRFNIWYVHSNLILNLHFLFLLAIILCFFAFQNPNCLWLTPRCLNPYISVEPNLLSAGAMSGRSTRKKKAPPKLIEAEDETPKASRSRKSNVKSRVSSPESRPATPALASGKRKRGRQPGSTFVYKKKEASGSSTPLNR